MTLEKGKGKHAKYALFDVAALYGVETKRVNEAVRNNPDKFPERYILYLSAEEWNNLKSKFSTSSWGGKNKLPKAFTFMLLPVK